MISPADDVITAEEEEEEEVAVEEAVGKCLKTVVGDLLAISLVYTIILLASAASVEARCWGG